MARIDDGRNLLFGILALQNGLVDQADLMEFLPDGAIRVLDSRERAAQGRRLEELGGATAP